MDLDYKDAVTLYEVTHDAYGNDVAGTTHSVLGLYQQGFTRTHSANQTGLQSNAPLLLPADDSYIISKGYRLENLIVKLNPFGSEAQYFRIVACNPARDVLTENVVRHVECQLEPVGDFNAS